MKRCRKLLNERGCTERNDQRRRLTTVLVAATKTNMNVMYTLVREPSTPVVLLNVDFAESSLSMKIINKP